MITFVLKLAVSAGLIWLLLHHTDVEALWAQISGVEPAPFAAAVALIAALALPATMRWRRVLDVLDHAIAYKPALAIVCIGMFFNQVLPSNVGGDAVRAWLIRRAGLATRRAITSVVVDRLLGLSVVFLMTAIGLPWLLALVPHPALRTAFVVVSGCGLAGLVFLAFLDSLSARLPRWGAIRAAEALSADLRAVLKSRAIVPVLLLSILIQVAFALAAYATSVALGLHVTALQCLMLVPPVVLVMAVPVSVAGWGVREGAMVLAFGFIGVDSHDALALSVLIGAATMLASLPGGLVWLMSGRPRAVPEEVP